MDHLDKEAAAEAKARKILGEGFELGQYDFALVKSDFSDSCWWEARDGELVISVQAAESREGYFQIAMTSDDDSFWVDCKDHKKDELLDAINALRAKAGI